MFLPHSLSRTKKRDISLGSIVGISSCNTVVVDVLCSVSVAKSITSKMILPVILIFLSTVFAQDLYEGDLCSMSNGTPGVCRRTLDCPIVYQQLMAGSAPDKVCGFDGYDPIVCCPPDRPTTTTAAPVVAVSREGDGRGTIARQKCSEYARFVYAWKYPPILIGTRRRVNVSECAIKSQKLIVGGTKAERMEFPHMAAIGYNLPTAGIGWYCGGSLISENFVLTAAHCTYSTNWGNAEWVRVGDLNLERSNDGANPVERQITERIRHPEYKRPAQYHDIALLRLESRVPFNAWIRPACLHTAPSTGTEKAIATGWGHVAWGEDEGSSDLLKVTLPLVDSESCNATYTSGTVDGNLPNGVYGERMLCAGKTGSDTCQGDSGGPLVVFNQDNYCMYDVVGVTSLGRLCGSVIPGIYTRIYYYVPWIESVVWGSE